MTNYHWIFTLIVMFVIVQAAVVLFCFIGAFVPFYLLHQSNDAATLSRKFNDKFTTPEKLKQEVGLCVQDAQLVTMNVGMIMGLVFKGFIPMINRDSGKTTVLKTIIAVVVIDLWQFLFHRACHHLKALWKEHKQHHQFHNTNPFTLFANKPSDIFVLSFALPLVGMMLRMNLGVYLVVILINIINGIMIHSGFRYKYLTVNNPVFMTPDHHYIHHTCTYIGKDINCGFLLKWWDQIVGSLDCNAPNINHSATLMKNIKDRVTTTQMIAWMKEAWIKMQINWVSVLAALHVLLNKPCLSWHKKGALIVLTACVRYVTSNIIANPESLPACVAERAGFLRKTTTSEEQTNIDNCLKIFKKGSKTFYFASYLYPIEVQHNIAKLYSFCRCTDDMIDDYTGPKQEQHLKLLNEFLVDLKMPEGPAMVTSIHQGFANYKYVCERFNIPRKHYCLLARGYQWDVAGKTIETTQDLIKYSIYVAGFVGIISSYTFDLDMTNKRNCNASCALGIAFQLTNIARDIITDSKLNRVYIPTSWFDAGSPYFLGYRPTKSFPSSLYDSLNTNQYSDTDDANKAVRDMSLELIYLAEYFYKYAFENLNCLPGSIRPCILVAMLIYREIGMKIINTPRYPERSFTTMLEKTKLLATRNTFTKDTFIIKSDFDIEKAIAQLDLIY